VHNLIARIFNIQPNTTNAGAASTAALLVRDRHALQLTTSARTLPSTHRCLDSTDDNGAVAVVAPHLQFNLSSLVLHGPATFHISMKRFVIDVRMLFFSSHQFQSKNYIDIIILQVILKLNDYG
jgi:hypothetical protein